MSASQILVVEDERLVAMSIQQELEHFGYKVSGIASSAQEAVQKASETQPDLVLMDIHLKGGVDGIDAAHEIHSQFGTPVVFLSAFSDPKTVARASATEAFGYLLKPYEEQELQTTIEMALAKHRAEQRLEETERWLSAIHNGIREAIITVDAENKVRLMNLAAEALTGWRHDDARGLRLAEVCEFAGASRNVVDDLAAKAASESRAVELPAATWAISREGRATAVEGSMSPIFDSHGRRLGNVLALRDISPRLEAEELRWQSEERRQRAQKLDAVARMAGGLAQRLNDLLTVILGNTSLILTTLPETTGSRELLNEVEAASHHAAELAQRLMLFSTLSGRFTGQLQTIHLGLLMPNCIKEIETRLDSRIAVTYMPGTCLWPVLGDELLLGQALLELALNSRDAMPNGGQLTFEVDNVTVTEADITNNLEGQSGEFVRVRVSDNGQGMKPTVRARVFEPCFTTKGSGQRAGLGLALVYSVVKQLHGWIDYSSHVDFGTRFDLYLPRYGVGTSAASAPIAQEKPRGAAPTILLCDADPMVREVGQRILESHGYQVLLAGDGMQAVAVYQQAKEQIDLAILDLNMPRLSAYAVLQRLLECDPNVRVLFSGGYFSEDLTSAQGHTLGVVTKPYRPDDLADMVRRALASRCKSPLPGAPGRGG